MKPTFTTRSRQEIRVVLSTLVSAAPVWATAAQPIAELGVAVFVVAGSTLAVAGAWAPWIVAVACAIGAAVRAADTEAWAQLIPGGAPGCARRAFGERTARAAAALLLAERVLFAALATLIVGSYATNAPIATAAFAPLARHLTALDVSTLLAAVLVALFWIRSRLGLSLARPTRVNLVWIAIGVDADQFSEAPGFVLSSMVKRIDNAVYDAILSVKEHRFSGGIHQFGLVAHAYFVLDSEAGDGDLRIQEFAK